MGILSSRVCDNENDFNLCHNNQSPSPINSNTQHLQTQITHIESKNNDHVRQGSIRNRVYFPMPNPLEIEKRFTCVLVSLIY